MSNKVQKPFRYDLTDKQDVVLTQMLTFFSELGCGGDMNPDDFDSLFDYVMGGGETLIGQLEKGDL